jgi:D-alanine-D-alanine ligase
MRIGVAYDLRADYLAMGLSEEETAEFDSPVTIDAICDALAGQGWDVDRIGNVNRLVEKLAAGERWDAVFNFCEGLNGLSREAQVPALLECYKIPFVFSDAFTLMLTLDKGMCKRVIRDCGIATADFTVVTNMAEAKSVKLPFPLFLKPVAEGSGKGVDAHSKVESKKQLLDTARDLFARFHQPVLIETFLPGREFTVAIVGTGADAKVLGVSEITAKSNWVGDGYGYENKEYWEDKVEIIAADPISAKAAGDVALAAWRTLRCRDGGRVDIRNDADGKPNFIEVNPVPGLRPEYSDMCFIATRENVPYPKLIGRIMDSFLKRHPELHARLRAAA